MLSRWLLFCFTASNLVAYELADIDSDDDQEEPQANPTFICGQTERPMRVSARHIEGKGVGYNQGYTSVDGFFAFFTPKYWIPFLDLRGHIFNNGKPAANAGLGLRYLASQRVWGINGYYDYRQSQRQHYNQVSIGLETLGTIWDLRINGYLPVGDKKSRFSHPHFDHFEDHHMIISRKREFALKSANAEIGFHVDAIKKVPFYFAGGPYYLVGEGKNAWGGEARVAVDIFEYIRLESNASYDRIFKGIVQGQISLIIPFGHTKEVKHRKNQCSRERALWRRALQRVDRNEIIPLKKKRRESVAINPETKQPYFFLFVDNTSHSNGTFKSPFNTLIAAQDSSQPNDIIYVFTGDGTSTGMDQGIILKNNQKLLGSGNSYQFPTTRGSVTVPAFTQIQPVITNSINPVVACANNNEIAGMHITINNTIGIISTGIENVSIHDNQIDINQSTGIFVQNASGVFAIQNNIINLLNSSEGILVDSFDGLMLAQHNVFNFDNSAQNFGVHLVPANPTASDYQFTENRFLAPVGSLSTGFELGQVTVPIPDFNSLIISNNTFVGLGQRGMGGKPIGGFGLAGRGQVTMYNNIFSQVGAGTQVNAIFASVLYRIRGASNLILDIRNNRWENSQDTISASLNAVITDATARACVILKNNQSDTTLNHTAYNLNNTVGGTMITEVNVNAGTVTQTNTTPGICHKD